MREAYIHVTKFKKANLKNETYKSNDTTVWKGQTMDGDSKKGERLPAAVEEKDSWSTEEI